jgi:hypothetical protein
MDLDEPLRAKALRLKKEKDMIRVGTVVRLKGQKKTAKVVQMLDDIEGGVRLDGYLEGFRFWNVADLERVSGSPDSLPSNME